MSKLLCYLIMALIFITACSKKSDPVVINTPVNLIDVSKQWNIDPNANIISSFADGQWQMKSFTTQELNLFSSLDTANLTGTSTPGIVMENSPNFNSTYPNPFSTFNRLGLQFNNGYAGAIVVKGVVTDSTLTPVFKLSARINVTNGLTHITFNLPVPIGRFRFYYTLSSITNPHFYKTWGNIQNI